MGSPELSQLSSMGKHGGRSKSSSFLSNCSIFAAGATTALFSIWVFGSSVINPNSNLTPNISTIVKEPTKTSTFTDPAEEAAQKCSDCAQGVNLHHDPPNPTFYDDPNFSYSIEKPLKKWDQRRSHWMKLHPSFAAGAENRMLVVTGSQPYPCKNPIGDHLLFRLLKNKVDYCRIHGHDLFYNTQVLHPKMSFYWAKLPTIRAAMVAHPEVEWIMWVDSDAAFTDMDFKIPLNKYKNYNLVVHGYPRGMKTMKSWNCINNGVTLIRNCQWSIDFIHVWASMGPLSPDFAKWGDTFKSMFQDKAFPESDDQSAILYLYIKEKEKWGHKIYIEMDYHLQDYWVDTVGSLENISAKYVAIDKEVRRLRRRHAEKVDESYGSLRAEHVKDGEINGNGNESGRRPFVTHFTGCQPCSGNHNAEYGGDTCWNAMQMALNFADNQVLRNFGYVHTGLLNSTSVSLLPFDYPA